MSAATSTHSGAGPLGLMSCVRESSPLQDFDSDTEKNVATKKKMSWNPKKWFKRKHKGAEDVVMHSDVSEISKDPLRSRSTSELSVSDEQIRRRSGSTMHPGLSVSHDSVFHSPHSGSESELDAAQSSSSLSIPQPHADHRFQTELTERLRLRRHRGDTSEDDEGLPHSPCNSPSTTDGFLDKTANKDLPNKSHSTCSDGSLLSMCSSDMEEDSFGQQSRHSSRISLQDKKSPDTDSDLDLSSSAVPLNHSAAHHKVAVRPKRTHGAPRRKRVQQLSAALPTTPEVNEDSSVRSVSPDNVLTREIITEQYSMSTTNISTETKSKSSSLPLGASAPSSDSKLSRSHSNACTKQDEELSPLEEEEVKGSRSFFDRIIPRRSGKKKKAKEEKVTKEERHFISTVDGSSSSYTRHSHESTSIHTSNLHSSRMSESAVHASRMSESKPIAAPRSGVSARQRIQPLDIPPSPEPAKRDIQSLIQPKPSPEKIFGGTSPLSQELEHLFKNNRFLPASPPKSSTEFTKEEVTHSPATRVVSATPQFKLEQMHFMKSSNTTSSSRYIETSRKDYKNEEVKQKTEDIRNKMRIVGLSSLHEKILATNDDPDELTFKSLTDFSTDTEDKKLITKSHSFKCNKSSTKESAHKIMTKSSSNGARTETKVKEQRKSIAKASSLDSVKNLEEPQVIQNIPKLTDKEFLKDFIISEIQQEIMKNHGKKEQTTEARHLEQSETFIKSEIKQSFKETSSSKVNFKTTEKRTDTHQENFTKDTNIGHLKKLDKCFENKNKIVEKLQKTTEDVITSEETKQFEEVSGNGITISGPSHTAVVNITGINTNSTVNTVNFTNTKIEDPSDLLKRIRVEKESSKEITVKEQQVSITNIQLKRDTQVSHTFVSQKKSVPEFMNRQLNKVESKPTSTIICSVNTPKVIEEHSKLKTSSLDAEKSSVRKFSKEDIEIIEKSKPDELPTETKPTVVISSMTPQTKFKKGEITQNYLRKSSVVSITPEVQRSERPSLLRLKSGSLDSLKSDIESSDRSSQDSLDKLDENEPPKTPTSMGFPSLKKCSPTSEMANPITDNVTVRKKSFGSQNKSDEPELMKVFARRSLKLKDSECDALSQQVAVMLAENSSDSKTRDSDKENQSDSPTERKKSVPKESGKDKEPLSEVTEIRKTVGKEVFKVNDSCRNKTAFAHKSNEVVKKNECFQQSNNENTCEQKVGEDKMETEEEEEVTLRNKNPVNNKFAAYQRAISMQTTKSTDNNDSVKKQSSFHDRRKTDQWLSNLKNEEMKTQDELVNKTEIITEEYITETKNFNQRKAIWEKRAQESQKKTVP